MTIVMSLNVPRVNSPPSTVQIVITAFAGMFFAFIWPILAGIMTGLPPPQGKKRSVTNILGWIMLIIWILAAGALFAAAVKSGYIKL